MNTSPKLVPILVVAVLGIASLTLLTSAWGDTNGAPIQAAWSGNFDGPAKGGDGPDGWHGHHDWMAHCDRPGGGPGFHHHGWRDPARLAMRLNALETEIGIRTNQLDAWRDFTDALIATMTPPWLQHGPEAGAPGAAPSTQTTEPFARVQRLAENAIERGHHAEDLAKAIDALKSKLTPEQLTKVADIEARLSARQGGMGPHFGPPQHGPGPRPDGGPGGPDDETPPPASPE